MTEYADLEIGIHRRDAGSYAVEFRFSQPNSEADIRIGQDEAVYAAIDLAELNQASHTPAEYGRKLTESFFSNPKLQTAFAQARTSAQSLNAPLRLRLLIGPSAPELHAVRREMMRDPQDGSPLSTSENLLFSRYLSSLDWRPVRLRSRDDLRALVVVASPSDLQDYNLAPVDVQGEMQRVEQSLGQIQMTRLPATEDDKRATVN
ncbi:MAG: CHAT domain-containing protein, partial [Anaerolineales bacterium]